MAGNIIEEYLVRLGFSFDSASLNTALTNIANAKNRASSSVTAISKSVGAAFTGISTSIAGANIALGKFVTNMAKAELETETAANRMYMNVEAFDQVNTAAKALGYSLNDLSDIALSPELTNQFATLVQDMQSVGDQTHYRDNMREVRSLIFEFTRLKLMIQLGAREVVTDLIDMIGGDLEQVRRTLQSFVNGIQDKLPKISRRIAEVLTHVVRAGNMLLNVIKFVGQLSNKVFDFLRQFPGAVKVAGAALLAVFAALNPAVTAAVAGVGSLMIAIDDYMTYKQGGNSVLGEKWDEIAAKLSGVTAILGEIFAYIYEASAPLFKTISNGISGLLGYAQEGINDVITGAANKTGAIGSGITKSITRGVEASKPKIAELTERLQHVFSDDVPAIFKGIVNTLEGATEILITGMPGAIALLGSLITAASGTLSGIASGVGRIIQENKEILGNLLNTLFNSASQIIDTISLSLNKILPALSEGLSLIIGTLGENLTNILPTLSAGFSKIVTALGNGLTAIIPVLSEGLSRILNAFSPVIEKTINIVADTLSDVITYVTPLINKCIEMISATIEQIAPILEEIVNTVVPVIGDVFKTVASIFTNTLLPIAMQIVEIVAPVLNFIVQTVAPYVQRACEILEYVFNEVIGPLIKDALTSVQTIVGKLKENAEFLNMVLRPLFGFLGTTTDGMLGTFKKIVKVLEPILMPLTTIAKWGDNVQGLGEKVGNAIRGDGFKTNEELGKTAKKDNTNYSNQTAFYTATNTAKVNNAPFAQAIELMASAQKNTVLGGIKSEDLKKLGTTNNNDNKRITNTNNNTVNQRITINNSGTASNALSAATNAAQGIIKSMALSPVVR